MIKIEDDSFKEFDLIRVTEKALSILHFIGSICIIARKLPKRQFEENSAFSVVMWNKNQIVTCILYLDEIEMICHAE